VEAARRQGVEALRAREAREAAVAAAVAAVEAATHREEVRHPLQERRVRFQE
jgi:hypothetical protein